MATIGYFLSSEDHPGSELVDGAARAEQAGFPTAWISDHFHPWLDEQGHSPFVWSVIGAIAQATSTLRLYTAVTCPTIRIHPAILAQATATSQELMGGRFGFGVGSGEALNEHILGDHWPTVDVRLEMLEEAVEVIRTLWEGTLTTHYGEHYVVENARIYTLPETPPEILVSGFGPKAIELAARIGDGFITTKPAADDLQLYRRHGGRGRVQGGVKVCWARSPDDARDLVHRTWRNMFIGGQLSQDLPLPSHFDAAAELVTKDAVQGLALGPDPEAHIKAIEEYVDAGFDEVYVAQIGPDQRGMIEFYEREVLPHFA